ncbi:MAG TPA: NAD(P)H-binding protein [Nitrososphaeraceae archaeon]|nr:NAD(P)H-binding protein [Nitrososphaeraceae archaeon]
MQRYETGENVSYDGKESVKILVTGASGFIGSRVVSKLLSLALSLSSNKNYEILCLSRNRDSLKDRYWKHEDVLKIVEADVNNYSRLVKAMNGVNVAFYLIHSMEGLSKKWKEFAQKDRTAAENFAKAATECGVERIIYLGGLIHGESREDYNKLSEHMRSRKEVGDILRTSTARVTIFRAAIILGQGGGSFQMLEYLVKRLPVMVCPKWVLTKSQPISVDNVVEYLVKSINVKETEGRDFDIGGTEVLTYLQMMKRYAKMLNKSIRIIIIPFLTPRLSSYWVDLITPVRASLARPLIDSLKHEATVKDDTIKKLIPLRLRTFEEAVKAAEVEEKVKRKATGRQRTSHSFNNKLLIVSLFAMAVVGSTYYMLDARPEVFQISWLVLSGLWYLSIAFSLFFVFKGARLGTITAGIIGWITLAFWLVDNIYTVSGNSLIATSPDLIMTYRNFVGGIIAAIVVATSHNVYHKLRIYGI